MILYKFERLARRLTELGYPAVETAGSRIIKRDLTAEERAGNVIFKEDGIYLTVDEKEYKGYMYMKKYDIQRFGYPKFHITNCKAIVEQRNNGRFDGNYFWYNSTVVNIQDRSTLKIHENIQLTLCNYCRQLAAGATYSNTQAFFNSLDHQQQTSLDQQIQLDIFGYTSDWHQISNNYKKEKNYTCEKCGIRIIQPQDRKFIHTHHRNGDKTNNSKVNLQALCVLCHSHHDIAHIQNFNRRRMQRELASFIKKYKDELELIGNEYLGGRK